MAEKRVYFFGNGKAEGNAKMKELLGGKGANLAEMTNLGVPVPPGFTICTKVCSEYYKAKGGKWPTGLQQEIDKNIAKLERTMAAKLGDAERPLLVSVRSGAAVSMPGMMDTVLNLGLNDAVIESIIKKTGNARFAYDIYRRFIDMFGDVVMGCDHEYFEQVIDSAKKKAGAKLDNELNAEQLKEVVEKYKSVYRKHVGELFPQDAGTQLTYAINAVIKSWMIDRAVKYRQLNSIAGLLGTAVNVQAMVFGNMGADCATGVCFTRNPSTGKKEFYGEFLENAQGEDVVAGIRTPVPLEKLDKVMPKVYKQLTSLMTKLEKHYKDMQDMEFTVQQGKLYILQTRTGKRTAEAAVKMAVDMLAEKLIPRTEAVQRVTPEQLDRLLHPHFDPKAKRSVVAKGLPASPGAAVGQVVFNADTAEEWKSKGKKVVLVRIETSPEDIGGMDAAEGILTARGGMTSHAAVVARGMGKCCVAGVGTLNINYKTGKLTVDGLVIKQGDWISLDGSTGEVMTGQLATVEPVMSGDFGFFLKICDRVRKLGVRTNADTPEDAKGACAFGAIGIGLCRTEHMFFGEERLPKVRRMILADSEKEREAALNELLPYQREDFKGILKAMDKLPVIIRLLDPPLHEFLPKHEELKEQLDRAKAKGNEKEVARIEKIQTKVAALHESNPMLGHRGCRLGITFPEINRMQARAIFEAACELVKEGYKPFPEIMVPLVGHVNELKIAKEDILGVAKEVIAKNNVKIKYMIGTMIELPRAAITADQIATEAEFFSYGTNDLTQTTFGFSRDDIEGKFLPVYLDRKILLDNPFAVLDQEGVGQLVRIGIEKGRSARPGLEIGICGEHGGEPSSVEFCHLVKMDYVSCSPYRVPIAILAAAHAAIKAVSSR